MQTNGKSSVKIPDSKLARQVTELIRDTENELLFMHSARVYLWGALLGERKGVTFDPELLYVAAMFHDIGLTSIYHESQLRFEVDGANAARDFLRSHRIAEADIDKVWNAVALAHDAWHPGTHARRNCPVAGRRRNRRSGARL